MPGVRRKSKQISGLKKVPTGISGLDDITFGGLPAERITLVIGPSGAGKTVLAMLFILHGLTQDDEPGLYVSFEEDVDELVTDFKSMGYDLDALSRSGKLSIDHIEAQVDTSLVTGEYTLDGLLLRLGNDIESVGAKRVVLDGLGALFRGLQNEAAVRSCLDQLFRSLKDKGITTIITATTEEEFTQHRLGRTLSDCVILLGQRVAEGLSTRYLRVMKYRGSSHGGDEFPYLITKSGISLYPVTSVSMDYPVPEDFISSGIPKLDSLLGGRGFYRGSSVLVSGDPGTGKTSLAVHFAVESCRRGERCLYFALEEAGSQLARNMQSIGVDLEPWISSNMLKIRAIRPSSYGLEMHLMTMREMTDDFAPRCVVIDPMTSLPSIGSESQVRSMLARLIHFFKKRGITALYTALTGAGAGEAGIGVSSLMDTWINLQNLESAGQRNRLLNVIKSRGMHHSNQVREFVLTDRGIDLIEVYVAEDGVKIGAARVAEESRERAGITARRALERERKHQFENIKRKLEAEIAQLQSEIELARLDMEASVRGAKETEDRLKAGRDALKRYRH